MLINSEPVPTLITRLKRHASKTHGRGWGVCIHQKRGKWMLGRDHKAHYTSQTLQSPRWYSCIPESTIFIECNVKAALPHPHPTTLQLDSPNLWAKSASVFQ